MGSHYIYSRKWWNIFKKLTGTLSMSILTLLSLFWTHHNFGPKSAVELKADFTNVFLFSEYKNSTTSSNHPNIQENITKI